MKTINVRILVRNELDEDVAIDQLVRGVIKLHGAVELTRNTWGQLVPTGEVRKRGNVVWNGQETPHGDG